MEKKLREILFRDGTLFYFFTEDGWFGKEKEETDKIKEK